MTTAVVTRGLQNDFQERHLSMRRKTARDAPKNKKPCVEIIYCNDRDRRRNCYKRPSSFAGCVNYLEGKQNRTNDLNTIYSFESKY